MYSILIVEDDLVQSAILKTMIESLDFKLSIYQATNELEALNILNKYNIDMFFMDIDLGSSSGLELAFKIRGNPQYEFSWIIFLTTHMQYITQAFKEIHCYDYILKPYDKNEVLDMVRRIILHENKDNTSYIEKRYVSFNLKDELYIKVYIDEIIFIEVLGRMCIIHTKHRDYPVKKMSLKKILKLIDCNDIIQSHKSFVVNTKYISKIIKIDNRIYDIYFENQDYRVPLGYKFKDYVFERLNK
nr:LytTR family DNA-binding domain-containing protein [Clostridium botulinum]